MTACEFDMCALEDDPEQSEMRCSHYKNFVNQCYDYAQTIKSSYTFTNWTGIVDCRKSIQYLNLNLFFILIRS